MHGALRVGQDFAGLRQWGGCAERKEQPPLTNPDQLSACSLGPLPLPCTALSSSHISHISYIQRGCETFTGYGHPSGSNPISDQLLQILGTDTQMSQGEDSQGSQSWSYFEIILLWNSESARLEAKSSVLTLIVGDYLTYGGGV